MLSASQQKVVSCVSTNARSGTLAHAYIIYGPDGIGKSHVADLIKQYIMCNTKSACGSCNGCLTAINGSNPDLVCISNGDKKIIEIKKIRELIKSVFERPINSEYKLFVIDNAHLMEGAGQNALLKVIEEPPPYAVFILLCNRPDSLLQTIRSRSFKLELYPWSEDELRQVLTLDADNEYMYNYCMGNPGELKKLAGDKEFMELRCGIIDSFVRLGSSEPDVVSAAAELWKDNSDRREDMMNILTLFLRDTVLYKNNLTTQIVNKDKITEIRNFCNGLTAKQCLGMLEHASDSVGNLGKYDNVHMAALAMFMGFKEEING